MMRLYKIATDLVKAMKEDKLNSKIWKEVQETPFKTRKELVEKVEREFSCVEMQYPENYQETQAKKLAEKDGPTTTLFCNTDRVVAKTA